MTPEKYVLAGELFHRVRDLTKADRDSALEIACKGDIELRAQVSELLEGDEAPAPRAAGARHRRDVP